jgi:hypothetical protein
MAFTEKRSKSPGRTSLLDFPDLVHLRSGSSSSGYCLTSQDLQLVRLSAEL